MRILPAPQVVPGGPAHGVLYQAKPGLVPAALKPRQVVVAGVGDGEERQTPEPRRRHVNLEPLPDGRGDDLASCQAENVLRDFLPDGVTGGCALFEQPVRDDHPPRRPPDRDRCRGAGQQEAPLRRRRLRPDQERQAAQVHPPERDIARLAAKNIHARVAHGGQVNCLIARHASDRRPRARPGPVNFCPPGSDHAPVRDNQSLFHRTESWRLPPACDTTRSQSTGEQDGGAGADQSEDHEMQEAPAHPLQQQPSRGEAGSDRHRQQRRQPQVG